MPDFDVVCSTIDVVIWAQTPCSPDRHNIRNMRHIRSRFGDVAYVAYGSGPVPQFTGGAVDGASLADGRYTLWALASEIPNLDGNGDGIAGDDYVLASAASPNPPTNIFRLFGDVDGDGTVAASDFIQFRLALGGKSAIFDFDGDGSSPPRLHPIPAAIWRQHLAPNDRSPA